MNSRRLLPPTFQLPGCVEKFFSAPDIGGILVNKQVSDAEFNRTYGVDANLRFLTYLTISSFLLKTDTSGIQGQDTAADLTVGWWDRFWEIEAQYLSIQDNFSPEVGFAPRTGIRKSRGRLSLHPRPGERVPWAREFRPVWRWSTLPTRRMFWRLETSTSDFQLTLRTVPISGRSPGRFERLEEPFRIRDNQSIPVGDYQFAEYATYLSSDRSRMFSLEGRLASGSFWNGHRDSFRAEFHFQPGYQFGAEVSWNHDDITLPSGDFTTTLTTTPFTLFLYHRHVFKRPHPVQQHPSRSFQQHPFQFHSQASQRSLPGL